MTDLPTRRRLLLTAAAAPLAALAAPLLAGRARADEALIAQGYAVGDMTLGAEDAPVTIVEYASLTCPHCATFHNDSWPAIKRDYVETGKVRFIYRDVYFDQFGLWGAMLARCNGEAPFFGYLDMLMKRQSEWSQAGGVDELMRIGRLGGLSNERMQQCLTDEAFMRALVEDYQQNVAEDGVRSTPTFFINGDRFTGAMSSAEMAALIDERL